MGKNTANRSTGARTVAKPEGGGKGFLIAIIAIVLVGAAAVALLAAQRDSKVGEQTAAVQSEGEALPAFTASGVSGSDDEALGLVAPTLTGTTLSGDAITIGPDGEPKVIYFLAHWCAHCQAEVPKIQQMINDGSVPEGLQIYAVSTAVDLTRGNYPPESWLDVEGFTPITMRDDEGSPALAAYGGSSFPYVVYLDGDNRVIARSSGELDEATILQLWGMTAANASLVDSDPAGTAE